ncbi:hypothetical protein BDV95DRAFT_609819 [Massariosphaeria phaeospora]|uniref:Uncharacterized protein n=1 Tax=Massariosphaeria phaeospora TaxID=100035 RepID=A0A7C8I535_9PLEO|nr:hypothetical protein BDV95DRAFT_609819 [Massariosphaeria phaeospora]
MVNWTAEKDATLMRGLFKHLDIKFTNELCKELADAVGEGCTPKAAKNRLYSMKTYGKMTPGGDTGTPVKGTPTKATPTKKTATPKATNPTTPKAKGRTAKTKDKNANANANTNANADVDVDIGKKLKRGRKMESADEHHDALAYKKVKMEIIDDGGEDEDDVFGRGQWAYDGYGAGVGGGGENGSEI